MAVLLGREVIMMVAMGTAVAMAEEAVLVGEAALGGVGVVASEEGVVMGNDGNWKI